MKTFGSALKIAPLLPISVGVFLTCGERGKVKSVVTGSSVAEVQPEMLKLILPKKNGCSPKISPYLPRKRENIMPLLLLVDILVFTTC